MKNVLLLMVFVGLFSFSLTGCGGSSEPTIVPPAEGNAGGVPTNQMEEYKKSMESGGSSKPGN